MNYEMRNYRPTSVGSWIATIILSAIPVVNIIYWIVLLFGGGDRSKVNLIRAIVLLELIGVVVCILGYMVLNHGIFSSWNIFTNTFRYAGNKVLEWSKFAFEHVKEFYENYK